MFRAAYAATEHYYTACKNDPNLIDPPSYFTLQDIGNCSIDLENTYFIQIFAIFEAALRDFWKNGCGRSTHPAAYVLLNSIASHCSVPSSHLENTQRAREFRNNLVHEKNVSISNLPLAQGRRYLARFLSYLPQNW